MAATGRLNTHLSQGIYCFVWVGFQQLLFWLILVLLDTLKPKLWGPVWRRSQSSKSSMPYTTRQVQMSPNWLQCTVLSWSSSPSSHLNIFLVRCPVIYECYSHATPINPTCKILQVMLVAICHCTIAWVGMKLSTYCQFNICCVTQWAPKKHSVKIANQPVSNPKRIIEHWWFLVLSPFNNGSLHYNLHARRCIALFPAVLFAFGQQGIQFLESHLLSDRGWRARRSKMKQEHQVFQSDLSQKVKGELQFWNWGVTLKRLLQFFLCVNVSLRHFPRHLQSCRILRRRRNSRASSSRSPHSKATLGAHWVGQLRSSMQEEWISPPKGLDILLHSTEAFFKVRTWINRIIDISSINSRMYSIWPT